MLNNVFARTGKSLRELAEITGISYSRLSLITSNKVKPSYDTLQRLYSTLKLTPVELALIMKNGDIKGRNKVISEYGKQDKVESSKE